MSVVKKPTARTKHRARSAVADLYTVPEDGKAEIVGGKVVRMSPAGDMPGRAGGEIDFSLRVHERQTGAGFAFPDNVAFLVNLPHRQSLSPDAAFYTGKRTGMKFLEGAPIFAAEVRSENDYGPAAEETMADKRADYFATGTQVVWDVDLLGPDVVKVYRADDPEHPTIYRRGDVAEARPALPGWEMPVNDLFV